MFLILMPMRIKTMMWMTMRFLMLMDLNTFVNIDSAYSIVRYKYIGTRSAHGQNHCHVVVRIDTINGVFQHCSYEWPF